MPAVNVSVNVDFTTEAANALIARLSAETAEIIGKPEKFLLVTLNRVHGSFGGSQDPMGHIAVMSIGGLEPDNTARLSAAYAEALQTIGVPSDRMYIHFEDAARHMVGWSGRTFA